VGECLRACWDRGLSVSRSPALFRLVARDERDGSEGDDGTYGTQNGLDDDAVLAPNGRVQASSGRQTPYLRELRR